MKRKIIVIAMGLVGLATTAPVLAADAIEERRSIYKAIGDDTRPVTDMIKRQVPFDLATVKKALATQIDGAAKLPALFPDNSRTGKTDASPRIWAERARFDTLLADLVTKAKAADAAITDQASLEANFPAVLATCKACHDDYRIKR